MWFDRVQVMTLPDDQPPLPVTLLVLPKEPQLPRANIEVLSDIADEGMPVRALELSTTSGGGGDLRGGVPHTQG